ncbi:DUF1835 domain-containing protein [Paenibacillus lignilyticus]|uniref:DUF1835 domain-containing protein n=1 Tax=Paenibacillus lignilyticus TaxID=1172615 RepID=A0ABS5C8Z1_9BACL|nr:DUF1835 domain-containing protein [Paenibacillus lignilyticus]MBP3962483.1 DUF1835 domain-containing protein [Paenibacillus lignilyticus]
MLHITNGDHAAALLGQTKLFESDRILPWRESWIDGPLSLEWWGQAETSERAEWMEHDFGVPGEHYRRECEAQLAVLTSAVKEGEDIVLWFEYDLFDQAMLAALLYWLWRAEARLGQAPKLCWIIAEEVAGAVDFRGLGQLSPEQLGGLWPERKAVSVEELAAGARAWEAYAAGGREPIKAWLLSQDAAVLPVMAAALRFQLQRIPTEAAGDVGIVERLTLQALAAGEGDLSSLRPDQLFRTVSAALPMLGMGDLSYWAVLKRMSAGESPLIIIDSEESLPGYDAVHPIEWSNWQIRLAADGIGKQ